MEMHVDMICWDEDCGDAEEKRGFVLIVYSWFNAVLIAISETIGRKVVWSWTIRSL